MGENQRGLHFGTIRVDILGAASTHSGMRSNDVQCDEVGHVSDVTLGRRRLLEQFTSGNNPPNLSFPRNHHWSKKKSNAIPLMWGIPRGSSTSPVINGRRQAPSIGQHEGRGGLAIRKMAACAVFRFWRSYPSTLRLRRPFWRCTNRQNCAYTTLSERSPGNCELSPMPRAHAICLHRLRACLLKSKPVQA